MLGRTNITDWKKYGLFGEARDENTTEILQVTLRGNPPAPHVFPRPLISRYVLESPWSIGDACYKDPSDNEDPAMLARRFAIGKRYWSGSTSEIEAAEAACKADDVRVQSGDAAAGSEDKAGGSLADV